MHFSGAVFRAVRGKVEIFKVRDPPATEINAVLEGVKVQNGAPQIPLDEDNQEDIFLDSLDNILAQCVEKQIEDLQAKARSVGLSAEEKRELLALMLDLKA